MNKRVFEFAKEVGLTSKDVLERCKKLGHTLPSQLTVMEDKVQMAVRRDLGMIADAASSVSTSPRPRPNCLLRRRSPPLVPPSKPPGPVP